jgi:hypothetical protein
MLPSIFRLGGLFARSRSRLDGDACRSSKPMEAPLRPGEVLAAATLPDFGCLPLEFWPGYRRLAEGDGRTTATFSER